MQPDYDYLQTLLRNFPHLKQVWTQQGIAGLEELAKTDPEAGVILEWIEVE